MRVSNFNRFNYDLNSHKSSIAKIQKEIQQDGISYEGKNSVRNTSIKLQHDDTTSMLTSQIKSLYSIQNNMNIYDTNLQSIGKSIDKFRELMVQKENSTLSQSGIQSIDLEMEGIIDFVKSMEEQKLNSDEDLYGFGTELVIGNNNRMTRSFTKDIITFEGNSISDTLSDLKINNNTSIIDKTKEKINLGLAEVGMISSNSQRQIDTKELYKAYEEKYLTSLGSVEERITELNNYIQAYESHMLMISKVQDLSLVNYL